MAKSLSSFTNPAEALIKENSGFNLSPSIILLIDGSVFSRSLYEQNAPSLKNTLFPNFEQMSPLETILCLNTNTGVLSSVSLKILRSSYSVLYSIYY